MVILENDYLRVKIFPEIGGKIWSVYDKKQGKEMFYDNKVVKFREISLRGPWTSGGIEFNYGIIGHAPSCASPVDYKLEQKADGSVSCYIGVQELLTQSRWRVEINLPSDAAYLRTSSFWHNYSDSFQPYYTWANSGVTASDDLEIIYPGSYNIGHDGRVEAFPIDEKGRDLSQYSQQAFGLDKSFHPSGTHKSYFGAYWANDDFGMLHYALRDEKLGRKYFSWAQSEQGDIWVDLLTDDNPQYVELQSGRLFNQNLLESINTPYKQPLFTPYGSDKWNEYWLPFSGIGRLTDMNLDAAISINQIAEGLVIGIYPIKALKGELSLKSQSKVLASKMIDMLPSKAEDFSFKIEASIDEICLDGKRLWSNESQEITRPNTINPEFSLNSAEGHAIYAEYLLGMRKYAAAEREADAALALEPSMVKALNLKAILCARSMLNEQANIYASKVLAIDTYNPQANYTSGIALARLGHFYDALDRFEIAAITSELRSASYLQIAKLYFTKGDRGLAEEYIHKSLECNANSISALELLYQINAEESLLSRIESLDPLCHFPSAERMIAGRISAADFASSIQEELKWQNYLELACFYYEIGLVDKAKVVLCALEQQNAETALWLAFLNGNVAAIGSAEQAEIGFVFPFRPASLQVLTWAVENGGGWQSKYLLAMQLDFLGRDVEALGLLSDDNSYAPYYAYRFKLSGDKADISRALELAPQEWRYRQMLALAHYRAGEYAKCLELVEKYYQSHKDNFHIGDTYVKAMIALGLYEKADKVLSNMTILPFEGQSGSHTMYRDIKLHLAVKAIDKGAYKTALARLEESRLWPKNLGVGKPYDELIDNQLEDCLCAIIYARTGKSSVAEEYLAKIRDEKLVKLYSGAIVKGTKGYGPVSGMISNMDSSFDKKLF